MDVTYDYLTDAAEIYAESFSTIRREADLSRFPDDIANVVVRMIHAAAQTDLPADIAFTGRAEALIPEARRRAYLAYCLIMGDSVLNGTLHAMTPDEFINQAVALVTQPRPAPPADKTGSA